MRTTSLFTSLVTAILVCLCTTSSQATIIIPTVPVGNPGNLHDPRYPNPSHPNNGLVGAVASPYRIGTTGVTNAQYTAFLNAVATLGDPLGLYSSLMESFTVGGITRTGTGTPGDPYAYAVKAPTMIPSWPPAGTPYAYDDKPVVFVSWGDAARFANWLHNGQPTTGVQDSTTTEDGAYTLGGATSDAELVAVARNAGARWFLPSEDEWYKAAYHKNDGPTANYWDYPTGTDAMPDNNLPVDDTGNSANFRVDSNYTTGNSSYPLTDAGAYTLSVSPYGTFDQGGNVREWNETLFFGSLRGGRGGGWWDSSGTLHSVAWGRTPPTNEYPDWSFRVATVPEPSTMCLGALAGIGLFLRRRR